MSHSRSTSLSRLDADSLEIFLAVADHGGVLAAARAVGRSQPAVSERIRQLESTLGVALFLRTPRGMTLTDAGRQLVAYARRVHNLLEEAAQIGEGGPKRAGRLVLAASTTPASFLLPPLLAEFARRHEVSGIELRVGNTEDVLTAVREGVVPLGMVEGLGRAPGVSLRPFREDIIVPVFAPDRVPSELAHAIAKVKNARDVAALPLLWREPGSGTRRIVETALVSAGVPMRALRFDTVLGSTLALKSAALAGIGVAFLPRCAIGQELLLGQLVMLRPIRGLRIRRLFRWALPAGGVPEPMAAFQHFAQRHAPAALPESRSDES
ncbi:MAG TPA: LysR substrate-binding domain-containing protein [Opitutaceae bacterium]|nr:LysR substrate-binding domain-containing protein [Opitutaceae bacterium]